MRRSSTSLMKVSSKCSGRDQSGVGSTICLAKLAHPVITALPSSKDQVSTVPGRT